MWELQGKSMVTGHVSLLHKEWYKDQMHWHVRRACEMCRILGPDPDLQSQILCFAKILADVYLHYSLGSSFISFKGYFHSLISKRLIVR